MSKRLKIKHLFDIYCLESILLLVNFSLRPQIFRTHLINPVYLRYPKGEHHSKQLNSVPIDGKFYTIF